jgi:hypothetical protein
MTEGIVIDQSENGRGVSKWVEGPVEKSIWVGLKLKGKKQIETRTYRCNRCGFLESYAPA